MEFVDFVNLTFFFTHIANASMTTLSTDETNEFSSVLVSFTGIKTTAAHLRRDRSKSSHKRVKVPNWEELNGRLGPFRFQDTRRVVKGSEIRFSGISHYEKTLLQNIITHISESLLEQMVAFNSKSSIPRRFIDFALVTEFNHRQITRRKSDKWTDDGVNPSKIYDQEQSAFHREGFDIFRRGGSIYFKLKSSDEIHYTTVAQLRFFCAFEHYKLGEILKDYKELIESDKSILKSESSTEEAHPKRRRLLQANSTSMIRISGENLQDIDE